MKKFFSMIALLALSVSGFAQDVDNFEVGPYEVDYKGTGDYKFRIRKDVDLYEYYGLTKDTIINVAQKDECDPVIGAWNLNLQLAIPGHGITGCTNKFGLIAGYKQRFASYLYLNTGLSAAFSFGKYAKDWQYMSETMFEAGVPISVEFANIDTKKPTLFGSIGVSPSFYTSLSSKTDTDDDAYDNTDFSKSGFYLAPMVSVGGYLPVSGKLLKVGCSAQYNILFSDIDKNLFAQRTGRFVVGVDFGILF